MNQNHEIVTLLREIRHQQQVQLEVQQEALVMQREQFQMARSQFERAEKLQQKAENLQNSGALMMKSARRVLAIILPLVIALVIYLGWLLLR